MQRCAALLVAATCWRLPRPRRPPAAPKPDARCPPVPLLPAEAEAVLTWGGAAVRATFTFDRWGRVARCASRDFLRRLPDGSFEAGEWQLAYSGHMLFG